MIKKKILLADDERRVRETFVEVFDEYQVISVSSGEEVLNLLRAPNDIDIVVLDVMMPGLSGIEALREIKSMNPFQKVVIFTGFSSRDIVIEALREHADDYIDKPFDIKEVKEIFSRLISEGERQRGYGASFRDNKIDKGKELIEENHSKSIKLKDISRELFLSPKYFSRLFKEQAGCTFSEYKIKVRMERARQLLQETELTVSEIAYQVGYQTPESFIKRFKKYARVSPSGCRERSQKEKQLRIS